MKITALLCCCVLAWPFLVSNVSAQKPEITKETFTYKTVGELDIKLDVHRADDDEVRPVAVHLHGGALIMGGRRGVGGAGKALLDAGYCVVSIDYRLAPETKLPEIIGDVEDAFHWIHANAGEKFNGDTSKLAVFGGSAGGCLTLTAGYRVKPRPAVLVAYWGYGDLIGDWYSQPSPHPRHQGKDLTDEAIARIENGPPVANAEDRKGNGGPYYQMLRRRGTWPKKVSGWDPKTEPEKFTPYMAARNVTKDYPPTLLIHGTKDTDVPHEQSEIMAREFEKHGVTFEFISVENGEHGLGGAEQKDIEAAREKVLPFIQKYTGR